MSPRDLGFCPYRNSPPDGFCLRYAIPRPCVPNNSRKKQKNLYINHLSPKPRTQELVVFLRKKKKKEETTKKSFLPLYASFLEAWSRLGRWTIESSPTNGEWRSETTLGRMLGNLRLALGNPYCLLNQTLTRSFWYHFERPNVRSLAKTY